MELGLRRTLPLADALLGEWAMAVDGYPTNKL